LANKLNPVGNIVVFAYETAPVAEKVLENTVLLWTLANGLVVTQVGSELYVIPATLIPTPPSGLTTYRLYDDAAFVGT
jgi:hypothetical protein